MTIAAMMVNGVNSIIVFLLSIAFPNLFRNPDCYFWIPGQFFPE
jgi:hypothetical protein